MGEVAVSASSKLLVLLVAYLAVFVEALPNGLRDWLGTQIDLLPALMVYCGLTTGLAVLTLTAVLGGLWQDSLSANPMGITVLPLFLAGLIIHRHRDLILRDQLYARLVLGVAASGLVPLLTVILLWGGGFRPIIGWGSLWQWFVLAAGGGAATPVLFWMFDRLNAALSYSRPTETTFRPDREIKRGRA